VVSLAVRRGVRFAVDVGTVRVGVAICDPDGVLASPLTVLPRDARGGRDLAELAGLVATHEPLEVMVGLPRSLSGREGPAAAAARDYAAALAARIAPVAVRLVDERLSTTEAARGLRGAGIRSKAARGVIDAAAAAVILQQALDTERSSGSLPGEVVA
jgi:putative Holliday junction resolvase